MAKNKLLLKACALLQCCNGTFHAGGFGTKNHGAAAATGMTHSLQHLESYALVRTKANDYKLRYLLY